MRAAIWLERILFILFIFSYFKQMKFYDVRLEK